MSGNMQGERGRRLGNDAQLRLLTKRNIRFARRNWDVSAEQVAMLRRLTEELQLSVVAGDLRILEGKWYVTHAGLLRIAQRNRCSGMRTAVDKGLSDPASCRWVFQGDRLQISSLSRLRRLRRRRSLQRLFLGPRRRDARRRNPRRQPRPPQGLRHRPLFGRGTWLVTATFERRPIESEVAAYHERK